MRTIFIVSTESCVLQANLSYREPLYKDHLAKNVLYEWSSNMCHCIFEFIKGEEFKELTAKQITITKL